MPLIAFKAGVAKKYVAAGINVKEVGKAALKKKEKKDKKRKMQEKLKKSKKDKIKKAKASASKKRKGSTSKDSRAAKKSKSKEKPVEILIEEEEEDLSLMEILEKASKAGKLSIERVTKSNAPKVHKELTKSYIKKLSDDRVKANFVYDYLSHVAGKYLPGASKLKGKIPSEKEYSTSNKDANFFWAGIKIFVLRDSKSKKIKDLLIFHNAYLTSNPGPDKSHHNSDPVMRKTKNGPNFAPEVGNAHLGSKKWAETPVMVGEDIDLMIAITLAECGRKNMLVATDGEGYDDDLIECLSNWGFKKVFMTHPKTKKPWLEQEGKDELHVMYRAADVAEKEFYDAFDLKKPAAKKKAMKVVKPSKRERASYPDSDSESDLFGASGSPASARIKKLESTLKKKDKLIEKLEGQVEKYKKKLKAIKSAF